MSKLLKLNSYSRYDELYNRDYMVYEVEYDNGYKAYISRDVFRRFKALEIIKNKKVNVGLLLRCATVERYNKGICYEPKHLTQEEYDLLKEVLL